MKQITQAEHDMLREFAARFGRNWKSILRLMWETTNYNELTLRYGDDTQILHRIRNTHGPAWLARFRLADNDAEETIFEGIGGDQWKPRDEFDAP
jgi:hypothetical protein